MKVFAAALSLLALAACVDPPTVVVQPLRVINWSPASGATCIDPDVVIHVSFSDDIVTGSLDGLTLTDAGGDAVTAPLTYDKATFTATLTPAARLTYGAGYTVVAADTIEGADLGRLLAELTSTFEVIDSGGCVP